MGGFIWYDKLHCDYELFSVLQELETCVWVTWNAGFVFLQHISMRREGFYLWRGHISMSSQSLRENHSYTSAFSVLEELNLRPLHFVLCVFLIKDIVLNPSFIVKILLSLITRPNLVILTASHNNWFLWKRSLVGTSKPNKTQTTNHHQKTQKNPTHKTPTKGSKKKGSSVLSVFLFQRKERYVTTRI